MIFLRAIKAREEEQRCFIVYATAVRLPVIFSPFFPTSILPSSSCLHGAFKAKWKTEEQRGEGVAGVGSGVFEAEKVLYPCRGVGRV